MRYIFLIKQLNWAKNFNDNEFQHQKLHKKGIISAYFGLLFKFIENKKNTSIWWLQLINITFTDWYEAQTIIFLIVNLVKYFLYNFCFRH